MKRISAFSTAVALGLLTAACGGGEPSGEAGGGDAPAAAPEAPAELTMPAWITHDAGANTVAIELTAGQTTANNSWNYNGFYGGDGEIVVPVGAEVTITLVNQDQAMAHSVGVGERASNYPANFTDPQPVFEGGMTGTPTSLTEATLPGETETITFTVDQAGEYSLICYVPGHAAVGMYLDFTVTDDGSVGFRG